MRTPIAVALALVLAFGCTDQTTSPTALNDSAAPAPAFDWMNNPDNGNIKVYRSLEHWAVCWSDDLGDGNGLRACHGTVPLGGGDEPDCGLQEVGDPIPHQDVGEFIEDDPFSSFLHAVNHGDIFITIRDENAAGACFDDALVAEGWGRFSNNDNDLFGSTDPNANTWRFRAHGKLTAPDGSPVMYNGHLQLRFNNSVDFAALSAVVNAH